ncbi:MAG: hypothetical protein ACLQC7_03410, partial [Thermoplasmata archaeon]
MVAFAGLSNAPFVTVSPVGLAAGFVPNNGANFGPDTSGTSTGGIQEALNLIATTGGMIYCYQGAYAVGAPFAYTGPNQMIWFEPGSSLTFANGLTGSSPGWF